MPVYQHTAGDLLKGNAEVPYDKGTVLLNIDLSRVWL